MTNISETSVRCLSNEPILSAKGLEMEFRGFKAINGLDFDVASGSLHGIIGPNGAGKTTLFNLLTKFLTPTSGAIHFDGKDITNIAPARIAAGGMVRSFQISAVFGTLSVRDNIRVALQRPRGLAWQFWRSSKHLAKLDETVDHYASAVGLDQMLDIPAAQLSYGRKRALEIATTIALEPRVLLLDEPMAGLAREDFGSITELIRTAAKGRTVVMIEHNLPVVEALCDTITVLDRGRVLAQGPYREVSSDPRVRLAYLGAGND